MTETPPTALTLATRGQSGFKSQPVCKVVDSANAFMFVLSVFFFFFVNLINLFAQYVVYRICNLCADKHFCLLYLARLKV